MDKEWGNDLYLFLSGCMSCIYFYLVVWFVFIFMRLYLILWSHSLHKNILFLLKHNQNIDDSND